MSSAARPPKPLFPVSIKNIELYQQRGREQNNKPVRPLGKTGNQRDAGAVLEFTSDGSESVAQLAKSLETAEHVPLREMYPEGRTWSGQPLGVRPADMGMTLFSARRELALLTTMAAEGDGSGHSRRSQSVPRSASGRSLAADEAVEAEADASGRPLSGDGSGRDFSVPHTVQRKRELERILVLLQEGARRWKQYRASREAYVKARNVPLDDPLELARFDEEFRRAVDRKARADAARAAKAEMAQKMDVAALAGALAAEERRAAPAGRQADPAAVARFTEEILRFKARLLGRNPAAWEAGEAPDASMPPPPARPVAALVGPPRARAPPVEVPAAFEPSPPATPPPAERRPRSASLVSSPLRDPLAVRRSASMPDVAGRPAPPPHHADEDDDMVLIGDDSVASSSRPAPRRPLPPPRSLSRQASAASAKTESDAVVIGSVRRNFSSFLSQAEGPPSPQESPDRPASAQSRPSTAGALRAPAVAERLALRRSASSRSSLASGRPVSPVAGPSRNPSALLVTAEELELLDVIDHAAARPPTARRAARPPSAGRAAAAVAPAAAAGAGEPVAEVDVTDEDIAILQTYKFLMRYDAGDGAAPGTPGRVALAGPTPPPGSAVKRYREHGAAAGEEAAADGGPPAGPEEGDFADEARNRAFLKATASLMGRQLQAHARRSLRAARAEAGPRPAAAAAAGEVEPAPPASVSMVIADAVRRANASPTGAAGLGALLNMGGGFTPAEQLHSTTPRPLVAFDLGPAAFPLPLPGPAPPAAPAPPPARTHLSPSSILHGPLSTVYSSRPAHARPGTADPAGLEEGAEDEDDEDEDEDEEEDEEEEEEEGTGEGSTDPSGSSRPVSRVEYEYQDGSSARDLGLLSPKQAADDARRAGIGAWAGGRAKAAVLGSDEVGRFWAAVGSPPSAGGTGSQAPSSGPPSSGREEAAGGGQGSPRRRVFKQPRPKQRRGSDGSPRRGSAAAMASWLKTHANFTVRDLTSSGSRLDLGSASALDTTEGSEGAIACEQGVVVLLELVGKGTNGRVYRARLGDRTVAVKRVSLAGATAKAERLARLEVAMLSQLKHPNVVEYFGTAYDAAGMQHLDMIMEFVEGCTLADHVARRGALPEPDAARIVAQVLDGLAYLHARRVIHRDLKPANAILTPAGAVKIIDFGVSAQLRDLAALRRSCVGTPWYLAPEVICLEQYSYQADCWAYEEFNAVACMFRMVNDPHPPFPPAASPACVSFLQACFTRNWRERPTAEQLRQHPFVTAHA